MLQYEASDLNFDLKPNLNRPETVKIPQFPKIGQIPVHVSSHSLSYPVFTHDVNLRKNTIAACLQTLPVKPTYTARKTICIHLRIN